MRETQTVYPVFSIFSDANFFHFLLKNKSYFFWIFPDSHNTTGSQHIKNRPNSRHVTSSIKHWKPMHLFHQDLFHDHFIRKLTM